MKNRSATVFVIVSAFVTGLILGMAVRHPLLDDQSVSGTIGIMKNYRNTKPCEADIQLKNDLIADPALLKSVKNYMNFFYLRAIELGKNIDFAVKEANAIDAFKTKNAQRITALENHGKFLGAARKDLLLAVAACRSIKETHPVFLRNSIVRANKMIARMMYGNSQIVNFIVALGDFSRETGADHFPGLKKALDLLTYHEVIFSLVLKDQPLIKFFEKRNLSCSELKAPVKNDFDGTVKQDIETLGLKDIEKLEVYEAAKIEDQFFDNEKPGSSGDEDAVPDHIFSLEDVQVFFNSESLN